MCTLQTIFPQSFLKSGSKWRKQIKLPSWEESIPVKVKKKKVYFPYKYDKAISSMFFLRTIK